MNNESLQTISVSMGGPMTTTHSLRILIVEDDNNRVKKFQSWLPDDMRLVHASSAGRVLGILQRDRDVYAGIMLDHDLQIQIATEHDFFLSGTNVVEWIIALVRPDIPVLVHSMNPADAPLMVKRLNKAGFSVTRMPMSELTEQQFAEWLGEVRECWAERGER